MAYQDGKFVRDWKLFNVFDYFENARKHEHLERAYWNYLKTICLKSLSEINYKLRKDKEISKQVCQVPGSIFYNSHPVEMDLFNEFGKRVWGHFLDLYDLPQENVSKVDMKRLSKKLDKIIELEMFNWVEMMERFIKDNWVCPKPQLKPKKKPWYCFF